MKKLSFVLSTMAMALIADPAHAAVTIAFTQGSAGVSIDVSGSIDPTHFTYHGMSTSQLDFINSRIGEVRILNEEHDLYVMPSGNLAPFGSSSRIDATSSSGTFGITWNGVSNNYLRLPANYLAGSALSASLFFSGATYASLGIDATDFSQDLGGGQIVNFAFGTAAPGVPEPATWAMMILGMGVAGAAMRRRSRQTSRVDYTFA